MLTSKNELDPRYNYENYFENTTEDCIFLDGNGCVQPMEEEAHYALYTLRCSDDYMLKTMDGEGGFGQVDLVLSLKECKSYDTIRQAFRQLRVKAKLEALL